MIIENKIGTISDEQYNGMKIDYLDIEWYNACKKIDRITTQNGMDIGIRQSDILQSQGFRDGDVVAQEGDTVVVIRILPCECLVMDVTDIHMLPKFCYEIGNRHAPFFYGEHHHQFVTPFDKPIMKMLEKIGVPVERKLVKINLGHSISSTTGGHSHSEHSHDDSHNHGHSHDSHTHSHHH